MGATGCTRGGWRCCGHSASPRCVATCAVNYCATRGSISPLLYPQLLATKEITSRHTVGLTRAKKTAPETGAQASAHGDATRQSPPLDACTYGPPPPASAEP